MFQDEYRRMNDAIHADEQLIRRALNAAQRRSAPRSASWRPLLITALCVLLVALPVLGKLLYERRQTVLDDQPTPTELPLLDDMNEDQRGVVLQYLSSADTGGMTCMWLSAEGPDVHADMSIRLALTVDETGESCTMDADASMYDEAARRASFLVPLIDSRTGSALAVPGGTAVTLELVSWTNPPQTQPDGSTLNTKTLCIRNPQELHFRMGGVGEKRVCGNYIYEILADGTVRLDTVLWSGASVTVPAELDGRRVSSVGTAFAGMPELESITLPEGIKVLNSHAFYGCENLREVHLPESLVEIMPISFVNCYALESIHIPDSVTTIGYSAFAWCTSLKEVHLPASLTDLGYDAFGHAALAYVDIPDGLTSIREAAFSSYIAQPEHVTIPASVTSIDESAFAWGVGKLIVEPGSFAEDFARAMGYEYEYMEDSEPAPRYASGDWLYTLEPDGSARLEGYTGTGTQIIVPGTLEGRAVSSVGVCFAQNKTITHVTLPEGMTEIAPMAFYKCSALESVTLPDSLVRIGSHAFESCKALPEIALPDGLQTIGKHAFNGCDLLTWIHIPASVTEIGEFAFNNNRNYKLCAVPGSYAETYVRENMPSQLVIAE